MKYLKGKKFEDQITLNSSHSLIWGNLSDQVNLGDILVKASEKGMFTNVENLGLFDSSTPNYTTYYPDVKAEDFIPKEEDFINPIFRLLSEVTVHKSWNPIFFPADVLKASMPLMLGQSIAIDHEFVTGNIIGSVADVFWQDSYKLGNKTIPAGINGRFKIDAKSNPRLARGINMDPPSINGNSVTVGFAWEKSHSKMDDDEFYNKLGSYDKDGKLIQRVAAKIMFYNETSLVPKGADPFARLLDGENKIVMPKDAFTRYSLSERIESGINHFMLDYKNLSDNPSDSFRSDEEEDFNINHNKEEMKQLVPILVAMFAMAGKKDVEVTEDNFEEKFKEFQTEFEGINGQVTSLTESLRVEKERQLPELDEAYLSENVPGYTQLLADSKIGKEHLSTLRTETTNIYKLAVGEEKIDREIENLISTCPIETLKALNKQYAEKAEEKFEDICQECGSNKINRASASAGDSVPPKADKTRELVSKKIQATTDAFYSK